MTSTDQNVSRLVPQEFMCPILLQLMTDPVIAADGHTYDRCGIEQWFQNNQQEHRPILSPMTGAVIGTTDLIPNYNIKKLIGDFQSQTIPGPVPARDAVSIPESQTEVQNQAPAELQLNANKSADGLLRLDVIPPSSPSTQTVRTHLVFVVDVSYSMTDEAEITDNSGSKERHGFCILDLVKHAMLTTLHSLGGRHSISIITFSDTAKTVISGLPMNEAGKQQAETRIRALRPESRTNLWCGLQKGLEVLNTHAASRECRNELLLFTDGVPNVEPPRGHLPTLRRYLEHSVPELSCTIRTFGFGFNLDSHLLEALAAAGPAPGTFSFIPDPSMLGTIFIHSVADILACTSATDIKLHIAPASDGAALALGELPQAISAQQASTGELTVTLGTIAYGQPRSFVFSTPPGQSVQDLVATVEYTDLSGSRVTSKVDVQVNDTRESTDESIAQRFRHEYCSAISNTIQNTQNSGWSSDTQTTIPSLLPELAERMRPHAEAHLLIAALLKDLEGEVKLAVADKSSFERWGMHYLRSLCGAHTHQKRNNFKDPGVQEYGGAAFDVLVDTVSDTFDSLPPPEPSAERYNGPPRASAYGVGFGGGFGGGCGSHAAAAAAPSNRRVQSMAVYNSTGNVCFGEHSLVMLEDGSQKPVKNVARGDRLRTVGGDGSARVVCAVRTQCTGQRAELVGLEGGAVLTPWHPVRVEGRWEFPCHLGTTVEVHCDAVYNFLLDSDHRIYINGVETVTLAHGLRGPTVEHDYFGTDCVAKDLKRMSGFDQGLVVLPPRCLLRHAETGLVVGLTQISAPALHRKNSMCRSGVTSPAMASSASVM
ncbi:hypothetical protein CYMTET_39973 [Cymbomonas tetramitiformis]|uniref:U-box domain-containing protein n=1 Tax=Cymbomonas tetramitiformis TaxID=36881 RepID=A0AAE0CA76_9CHLO|nr:hypothetical protein CYMTET_39973 [Cymbomonas tetramitiformis]